MKDRELLMDFVLSLDLALNQKQTKFHQEDDEWYDRDSGTYKNTEQVLELLVDDVRSLVNTVAADLDNEYANFVK